MSSCQLDAFCMQSVQTCQDKGPGRQVSLSGIRSQVYTVYSGTWIFLCGVNRFRIWFAIFAQHGQSDWQPPITLCLAKSFELSLGKNMEQPSRPLAPNPHPESVLAAGPGQNTSQPKSHLSFMQDKLDQAICSHRFQYYIICIYIYKVLSTPTPSHSNIFQYFSPSNSIEFPCISMYIYIYISIYFPI